MNLLDGLLLFSLHRNHSALIGIKHKRCLLKTTILYFNGNLRLKRLLYPMVVVVAELADWSLLTSEVCGSNVVIFSDDCCKDENK